MLNVGRLQVLIHLSVEGSIARAAEVLEYTPSAVSQQLRTLEEELGMTLATRSRTGVELTPVGRALVEQSTPVLGQLAAVEQNVRDMAGLDSGRVRLGSFSSAALVLLARAIGPVRALHPRVRLSLMDVEPPGGYEELRRGELDLLISHTYPGERAPDPQGLEVQDLLRDPLVAVIPSRWTSKADKGRLSISQLAEMPLICGGVGDANRTALDRTFKRYELVPRVEFETRAYTVSIALVASGAGATVVPRSIVRNPDPGIEVLKLEPVESRHIFCVYRPSARQGAVATFVEQLRTIAADLDSKDAPGD
jgi:DNA-binding transcriptional LysR family regulator